MTRPRTHYRDFHVTRAPLTVPCDRCSQHEAVDSTEYFGCLQAARKVWPDAQPVDSGRLSGT